MREFFEITDPEALKSFAVPERVKILELFEDLEPRTAKQIATELGENAARLHYHVKELTRVGLLEQVDTRVKGSIVEKYYQPVAKVIVANLRVVVEENALQLSDIILTPIRNTEKDLVRTLNHVVQSDENIRKNYTDTFAYDTGELNLTKEERREFLDEWNAMVRKYKELKPREDRIKFKQLLLLYPATPPEPIEEDEIFEDNE